MLMKRPTPANKTGERWWLSIYRSAPERKMIGTYIRSVITHQNRIVEEIRMAGGGPANQQVQRIPRIVVNLAVDTGEDDILVAGVGNDDNPLLLTAD